MCAFLPVLAIGVFLLLAFGLSENRKAVRWKAVGSCFLAVVLLAVFFIRTPWGVKVQEKSGVGITLLVECADVGTRSLFHSELISGQYACAAFSVLPSIIFIGGLTAILFHLGILQFLIRLLAAVMTRVAGITGAEALIAAANIFLGMVEAPFLVRPYLAKFTRSELFCMMTCGMATIAGGVMVAYASMLQKAGTPPGHLVIASILFVFSSVILAKIMVPETEETQFTGQLEKIPRQDVNCLDAACRGASEGTMIALHVLGMLIAFAALVAFANVLLGCFGEVGGSELTLQRIFAWIFSPIAFLLGIPWSECGFAGRLLGEKIVLNEFIAYMDMTSAENLTALSDRSRIILTYALCGFANLGSLAIMIGGISTLVPERRSEMARLAFRSLLAGTLAILTNAALVSLLSA